ncbi:ROK family protein [Microbacterium enclense]|uniref:ROK family protein n=1 Tax=Microbacterium enclense TaxID=993073 RepID=UPI003D75A01D
MASHSKSAERLLRQIRYAPGITRHELADTLGVSVTTVNPVVSKLMDDRLITEVIPAKADRQGIGRPRAGLTLPGKVETLATLIWGHGGLSTAVVTFDNRVLWSDRVAVDGVLTTEQLVESARTILTTAAKLDGVNAPRILTLGLPAPYEPGVGLGQPDTSDTRHGRDGFASWFRADPRQLLADELKIRVAAENDANLGALGETHFGAARGARAAIYVKLSGQGIGSGLTINGKLFAGSHGFAGEIAHVRVDDDSRIICSCGSRGCLEEKIGPNMLQQLHVNYGDEITYADLLSMIEQDMPGPTRLLQDAGRVAGRALADMCTFFNPNVLVLDAGTTRASEVLIDGVSEQIAQSAPPFARRGLTLKPAELGEMASTLGSVVFARGSALGTSVSV